MVDAAPPPRSSLEWALDNVGGGEILAVRLLTGGISHVNHLLRISRNGRPVDVVLRRLTRTDWADEDPGMSPDQEVATYGLLADSDVPAPRLIAADTLPRHCDAPALLLTRAPGRRRVRPRRTTPFLRQLAATLTLIHSVDPARAARVVQPYRHYYRLDQLNLPPWWSDRETWERAVRVAATEPPRGPAVFIHRDYHQGNTLWRGDTLTAVVDWTSAEFGPPEVDVAHMRTNLAVSFSPAAADEFLSACQSIAPGETYDPWWDVRMALDFIPDALVAARPHAELRRLEEFVTRAVAELGGRAL